MPLEAAGTLTRNTVSMWVAPRASEASSYSLGTALRAVSDTEMMEGRIMTASTRMAQNRAGAVGQVEGHPHRRHQNHHADETVHH